jgi:hypothetical protein
MDGHEDMTGQLARLHDSYAYSVNAAIGEGREDLARQLADRYADEALQLITGGEHDEQVAAAVEPMVRGRVRAPWGRVLRGALVAGLDNLAAPLRADEAARWRPARRPPAAVPTGAVGRVTTYRTGVETGRRPGAEPAPLHAVPVLVTRPGSTTACGRATDTLTMLSADWRELAASRQCGVCHRMVTLVRLSDD